MIGSNCIEKTWTLVAIAIDFVKHSISYLFKHSNVVKVHYVELALEFQREI